jgi:polysaccharide biosynthesis/export protein
VIAAAIHAVPERARAQQLPSGAGAGAAQNPDMPAQLRQLIQTSGLTPDQLRARLEAMGYPSSLLDTYLPGGTGGSDSLMSGQVLDAVSQLGLLDSITVDSLQGTFAIDTLILNRRRMPRPDTALLVQDTLMLLDDSVAQALAERERAAAALGLRLAPNGYPYNPYSPYANPSLPGGVGGFPGRAGPDTSALGRSMLSAGAGAGAYGLGVSRVDTSLIFTQERKLRMLRSQSDTGLLPIFGLNLFRRTLTQFQPSLYGPVDDSYRLGPGDQIVLILTGEVQLSRSLTLTREGFVAIPQVGNVFAANLTLGEFRDLLFDRLARVYSGVGRGANATTHVYVTVSRLRMNQVFVVGEVVAPGSYQISGAGTVLSALYAALGPTLNGSLRSVEVRRGKVTIDSLDVYDYLLRGDASHDVRLETGDIVFVPVHDARVKVTGEVVRPAIYELKSTETLADALKAAGGFTPEAARRRVQITRFLAAPNQPNAVPSRVVIDVASADLATGYGPPIPILPGDSIAVFRIDTILRNRVAVRGDVWTPGAQGLAPGERLSDALKLAGGVRPDAYLGEVLVTRLEADSVHQQLRTALRDSTGVPVDDIILAQNDAIQVFSLREMRTRRYVSIAGAVRRSGRFSYRDGMTLRDLVLLAGGLQESADVREAEIARLPESRAGGVTAVTIEAPLDSTYLVDRAPNGTYLGPPGVQTQQSAAPDVVLRPYDNVLIRRQPTWQLQRTIAISGEVYSPGRYTLTNRAERLTDVIKRAGGLTPEGDWGGIILVRKQDRTGRIGVDLARVLRDPHDRGNVVLADGDSIVIPARTEIVRVSGEVNAPTALVYVPGENINYYIRGAGGLSYRADGGRAYVTEPDGTIEGISHFMFFHSSPEPRPGATVYVPTKDLTVRPVDKAAVYALIAQIVGSLATLVIVARNY